MNPAYSVIFFTTASGAGYGLLFLLGVFNAFGLLPESPWFGLASLGSALILITAGLLSSTFHLGHPERAWRALSQWRTSWLSREGVVSVFTYIPAGLFGVGWIYLEQAQGIWAIWGLLASLGAALTVYCTGMIYASLKAIPAWKHRLVAPGYVLLGLATGAVLLNALLFLFGAFVMSALIVALFALGAGLLLKHSYWKSIDDAPDITTLGTATGLGDGVTVLDPPHTSTNYLQTEMGFKIARRHAEKLRVITLIALFAVPLALGASIITFPSLGTVFGIASVLSSGIGIVIERWLFFAEAQHVMTLYYGE